MAALRRAFGARPTTWAGVADDQVHLRLAGHLLAVDRLDIGRPFLEGLVTLSPGCIEGWVLLADIAIRLKDEEVAERCGLAVTGRAGQREELMLMPAAEAQRWYHDLASLGVRGRT